MVDQLLNFARRGRSRDNEHGFTLIELIVAIATGLVVSVAAMTWLIISINQQNAINSRSVAASQAEAGLQQFTQDLRNAMYESSTSPSTFNTVTVATNASAGTTSFTFEIPTPANDGTGEQVVWTCPSTVASTVGNCTRTVGGSATRTPITGVLSASFTLTEGNSTSTSVTVTGATTGTTTYPSGVTPAIASVAFTLKVDDISQLDSTGCATACAPTHVVRGVSNPITLQTTAELRNFA